jgi:hypothetical protein
VGVELGDPQREELLHFQRGQKRVGKRLTSGEGERRPDPTVHLGDEVAARRELPFRQSSEAFDRGFIVPIGESERDRRLRPEGGRTCFRRAPHTASHEAGDARGTGAHL